MRPKVEEMAMLVIAEGGSTCRPSEKKQFPPSHLLTTPAICAGAGSLLDAETGKL